MKRRKVCIDISNVVPGKGGSGGGIATYAINLVRHIDKIADSQKLEIYCIKNSRLTELEALKNLKVVNVSVNNSSLFSRFFWLHVRLPSFCLSNNINVLHRIVPELPSLKVCDYIITMHDFMFDKYLQNPHLKKYLSKTSLLKFQLLNKVGYAAAKKSNVVIVPTQTIKAELENKIELKNQKVAVTYEASEQAVQEPAKQRAPILKIGVVAGFYPHKGHLKALQLAKYFIESGFDSFQMSFRGSHVYQDYVDDIKKEITQQGIEAYVSFEPFVGKVALSELYVSYDVCLLLSEYEGFGLPVLEAQEHFVPVVCSDIPVFREILKESAYYLKPDFTRNDAEGLITVLKNHKKLDDMAIAGMENTKRFSWAKMAEETLKLY